VHGVARGEFARDVEAVVEVAVDLQQLRAVGDRLRQLAQSRSCRPARAPRP